MVDTQERTGKAILESFPTEQLLECMTGEVVREIFMSLREIINHGSDRDKISAASLLLGKTVANPQTKLDVTSGGETFRSIVLTPELLDRK